jgi:hypothetical protein
VMTASPVLVPVQSTSGALHAPTPSVAAALPSDQGYVTRAFINEYMAEFHLEVLAAMMGRASDLFDEKADELKSGLVGKEDLKSTLDGIILKVDATVSSAKYEHKMKEIDQLIGEQKQLMERFGLAQAGLESRLTEALVLQEEKQRKICEDIALSKTSSASEIAQRDVMIAALEEKLKKLQEGLDEKEKALKLLITRIEGLCSKAQGDVDGVIKKLEVWDPLLASISVSGVGAVSTTSHAGPSAAGSSPAESPVATHPLVTAGGGGGPAPGSPPLTASVSAGVAPALPTSPVAGGAGGAVLPAAAPGPASTGASASGISTPPSDASGSVAAGSHLGTPALSHAPVGGSAPASASSAVSVDETPAVSLATSGGATLVASSPEFIPTDAADGNGDVGSFASMLSGGEIPVMLLGKLDVSVSAPFRAFMTSTYKVYTNEDMPQETFVSSVHNMLLDPVLEYDPKVVNAFSLKKLLDPRMFACKDRVLTNRFDAIMKTTGVNVSNFPPFWKKNWHIVARHILYFDSVTVIKKFKDEVIRLAKEKP